MVTESEPVQNVKMIKTPKGIEPVKVVEYRHKHMGAFPGMLENDIGCGAFEEKPDNGTHTLELK